MATAELTGTLRSSEESFALAAQLRRLSADRHDRRAADEPGGRTSGSTTRSATASCKSLLLTFGVVIAFRGVVDLVIRRMIPWPSLFGTEDSRLREEDIVNRRRSWTWRFFFRFAIFIAGIITVVVSVPGPDLGARRDGDLVGQRDRTS